MNGCERAGVGQTGNLLNNRDRMTMKYSKSLLQFTLGLALLVTTTLTTLASDDPYTVFLDGRNTAPGVNTLLWDITAGPAGQIYAVGIRSPDGSFNDEETENIVMRSLDRGATWETVTATAYDGKSFISAKVDRDGNLYAMRDYHNAAELWRSTAADQGANVQHLTTFSEEFPGFLVTWKGMAVDAAGSVFVCGYRPVTSGRTTLNRWMVAKGSSASGGGLSWAVVDEFALDTKYGSFATGVAIRPSDDPSIPSEVWVRGTVGTKSGSLVALRRSTQGGAQASWQTVTTYAGDTRWLRGIGADGGLAVGLQGEVYDVGRQLVQLTRKNTEERWTTWRLAPGASSGQIVDQLPASSYALKAAVDAAGRVYVHGGRSGFDGSVLRASLNGNSGTWDDYDLAPGASFYGMALDDEGSLYLAGDCYDAELDWWLGCIRKLPAP
jgi:hypothetical protein